MNTSGIRSGDILRCNVRGQEFLAVVASPSHREWKEGGRTKRVVNIEHPLRLGGHLLTYTVTARQIVGHYAKRKGSI